MPSGSATIRAVGISGSPSPTSRSRQVVEAALARLAASGVATRLIDLATLPADALLGRGTAPDLAAALAAVAGARIVVAGTPIYRATYSGLLKTFFDLLPQDGLRGKVGVAIATGHAPEHALAIDHGLRPLFASVGATVVATGVYATSAAFPNGAPGPEILKLTDRAVQEALALSRSSTE